MKDVCVWLVGLIMLTFAARYAYQIWNKEISPTLSTWIIFLLGTGLSLATYAIAKHHDFRSGILNTMDVVSVAVVLAATLAWGKRNVLFNIFEKWYLAGVGVIIVYGLFSGDAFGSNIFTQALISLGYVPTVQSLLVKKKNTESFSGWSCGLVAGVVGLCPAIIDGNSLAILYAVRTIVLVLLIISVMIYCEFCQKKADSCNVPPCL